MAPVIRITQFKIPDKANLAKMAGLYQTLSANQSKNGKPYILSLEAGPSYDDARNQGYTWVSKSVFASKEDMDYYDTDCEAHKALKAVVKDFVSGPPLTSFYTPAVTASL